MKTVYYLQADRLSIHTEFVEGGVPHTRYQGDEMIAWLAERGITQVYSQGCGEAWHGFTVSFEIDGARVNFSDYDEWCYVDVPL